MIKDCEKLFHDYHFHQIRQEGEFTAFCIKNETGEGWMRGMELFPGLILFFDSLRMSTCFQEVTPAYGCLEINYCRSGCYEVEMQGGGHYFLRSGDMCVNDPGSAKVQWSRIPTGIYEGITLYAEVEKVQSWLGRSFAWAEISLLPLKKLMENDRDVLLTPSGREIESLFQGMYRAEKKFCRERTALLAVELFMKMQRFTGDPGISLPGFSGAVVESTRGAYRYLTEHPFRKTTLGELAEIFSISETNLKRCFKAMYGQSPGAFLRSERLHQAALLLTEYPERTIGDIALQAGYENPSKFSGAFKTVMGEPPGAYRKRLLGS